MSIPHTNALAITQGDPAGIGPEIIAKAFRDAPEQTADCLVVGDLAVMRRACALVGGGLTPRQIDHPSQRLALPAGSLPLRVPPTECKPPVSSVLAGDAADLPPAYGQLSARAGAMAADAVIWAARAALRGDVAGLVTAPLNKQALAAAGLDYPGHTELLQAEAAQALGLSVAQLPVRMMLANAELRTVLVSIHLSLRQAIEAVTFEQVLTTLRISHAALSRWKAGAAPRLAVAALNPHAGEGGRMGDEEIRIIGPAIEAARREGLQVEGPYPPDTVFMRARQLAGSAGGYDAVIAMYHDQGLIPVKYLGVEHGVNVTLGLPLVRTSPDHGTAFDIAGQGVAGADSLLHAIRMARELTRVPCRQA